MELNRTEILLYNAIVVLEEEGYEKFDIMDVLGMTEDEYDHIVEMNEPDDWYY